MRDSIPDKKTFYDVMTRNGFYLPSFKSGIVTIKYLENVKTGAMWVPSYK